MSLRIAHVIRDGGGTAPVELTVARKLRERGHQVTVYGPPEVGDHVTSAGFELRRLDWPPGLPDGPEDLMPRMVGAAAPWARELLSGFGDRTDLVVADCTAFGALLAARAGHTPCAALMPTIYVAAPTGPATARLRNSWAAALSGINRARTAVGLEPVPSVTDQLLDADRLLVLSSRAFELPTARPPAKVRYVGPQLPSGSPASYDLPDADDPLVLVSLSTTDQDQADVLRRIVAALAPLRVRALITVGPALDPSVLQAPANVRVERYVPHDAVLAATDLVVTHAGHGTVMAALSAGVPLVCLPMGRDQPAVAERVAHHGLGVSLAPTADVGSLRAAISKVLVTPSYRAAARRLATKIEPADQVLTEIESLAGTLQPEAIGSA